MRFLCLHGMGTNGKVFEIQTSRIRLALGGGHEYVFVDGTVPAPAAPGAKEIFSVDQEYLRFVKDDVDSVIKLYDDLSAFIASEGPFDGIMGFSEGAGVAASLLAAQEKSRATQGESKFQFKCGIFFCGAEAFDAPSLQSGKLRKLESSTDGQIITLPTAHIWAKEDTLHPKFGQSLRKVCMDAVAEEFLHDLGHAIPGAQSRSGVLEATRAIGRTIERAEQM